MGKERDLEIIRRRVRDYKIEPWEKESSRQKEKARLRQKEKVRSKSRYRDVERGGRQIEKEKRFPSGLASAPALA